MEIDYGPARTTDEKEKIMSKRCPDCGFVNEDSKIYCGSCGEPLDAQLRLMRDLEAQKKKAPAKEAAPAPEPKPAPRRKVDDTDYDLGKLTKEKKSSPLPWIILGVIAAAVIVAVIVLI